VDTVPFKQSPMDVFKPIDFARFRTRARSTKIPKTPISRSLVVHNFAERARRVVSNLSLSLSNRPSLALAHRRRSSFLRFFSFATERKPRAACEPTRYFSVKLIKDLFFFFFFFFFC
jgi:hypothetical protein